MDTRIVALLVLVGGCVQRNPDDAVATVPLGGECRYTSECARYGSRGPGWTSATLCVEPALTAGEGFCAEARMDWGSNTLDTVWERPVDLGGQLGVVVHCREYPIAPLPAGAMLCGPYLRIAPDAP